MFSQFFVELLPDTFKIQVLMKFNSLEKSINELKIMLHTSLSTNIHAPTELGAPADWPITNSRQFEEFEKRIQDATFKATVINTLRRQVSDDLGNSVRQCLKKAGTSELYALFNMEGRNKKKAFKGTHLCKIITQLCGTKHTDKQVEAEIGRYLKSTPFKKGVKKNMSQEEGQEMDLEKDEDMP
ncbi:uncharacterized protein LOC117113307 isoform X2 [Anneissia japonica]|uniref:uncharacterized protein LOC117113307 isoform X2 n=1 Tax=Anneissia japonica TaxID=1529436 RepID=UPI001425B082|nr:uncharacterized protein LOC117113307 isoform X2 [Anneissia japonica]